MERRKCCRKKYRLQVGGAGKRRARGLGGEVAVAELDGEGASLLPATSESTSHVAHQSPEYRIDFVASADIGGEGALVRDRLGIGLTGNRSRVDSLGPSGESGSRRSEERRGRRFVECCKIPDGANPGFTET